MAHVLRLRQPSFLSRCLWYNDCGRRRRWRSFDVATVKLQLHMLRTLVQWCEDRVCLVWSVQTTDDSSRHSHVSRHRHCLLLLLLLHSNSTTAVQTQYTLWSWTGVVLQTRFGTHGGSRIELIETTDSVHLCYKFFIACQLCSALVCPSVCLSHCGDNLNKTSLQSCDFHQTIVQNCSFWRWKDVAEIGRISPPATVFHRYPHSGIGENGYLQRLVEAIIRMTSSHFG